MLCAENNGESISIQDKQDKWYNLVKPFRKIANDSAARDSFKSKYENDYW